MELQVITPHVKRIKSVMTGRYLAINRKGKVISKVKNNLFWNEIEGFTRFSVI
jgi:Fibroblast growth factor.